MEQFIRRDGPSRPRSLISTSREAETCPTTIFWNELDPALLQRRDDRFLGLGSAAYLPVIGLQTLDSGKRYLRVHRQIVLAPV